MTATLDVSASGREIPLLTSGWTYLKSDASATYRSYSARPGLALEGEHTGDRWVIKEQVTGIFGQGPDAWAAAQDFRRALREHLEVLERQPALSSELQFQLGYLRAHV